MLPLSGRNPQDRKRIMPLYLPALLLAALAVCPAAQAAVAQGDLEIFGNFTPESDDLAYIATSGNCFDPSCATAETDEGGTGFAFANQTLVPEFYPELGNGTYGIFYMANVFASATPVWGWAEAHSEGLRVEVLFFNPTASLIGVSYDLRASLSLFADPETGTATVEGQSGFVTLQNHLDPDQMDLLLLVNEFEPRDTAEGRFAISGFGTRRMVFSGGPLSAMAREDHTPMIPLPAAVWLLAGGLGLLGVARGCGATHT